MRKHRRPAVPRSTFARLLPFAALALAAACSDANAPQPESGVFVRTRGQMHTPRVAFGAANVAGGALVAGGQDANAKATATVEIYDAREGTFTPTASPMREARFRPTVTELEDGRVLITGGRSATEVVLASAEIYDPKTGTLEPAENAMSSSRAAHVAVRLDDGTVLIAGGFDNEGSSTASADVFDPRSNSFRSTSAPMTISRSFAAAVLLEDGTVFIVGGDDNVAGTLDSAEIYDPRTGTFSATSPMSVPRESPTATLVAGGIVVVAGGSGESPPGEPDPAIYANADLYDPTTRSFTPAANEMSSPRSLAFAAPLGDGRAVICGGFEQFFGSPVTTCDTFDPTTRAFTPAASLNIARGDGASVVIDGTPLFVGGTESGDDALASGERGDAVASSFTITGGMSGVRRSHAAAALHDGRVLVSGGFDDDNDLLASAEVYDPNDDLVRPTSPMSQARAFHVMLTLGDGNVLVAGGSIEPVAELFDPKSGAFRDTAGAMTTPRIGLAGALLDNGLALLIGGADETGEPLATAELYDPASGTFVATGSMSIARQGLTATVLDDGRVLVAGGSSDGSFNEALASAEIYDPTSGTFSLVTSQMSDPRTLHTATLLADGRVLVAGGANSPPDDPMDIVPLSSLDIFDPATGAFSPAAAPLAIGRFSHTATAVAGGLVLIAGGTTPEQSTASAETFDPTTDAPSPTGDMNDARNSHTATAVELPGGHRFVLMAGGIASVPPNEIGTLASTERWAVP